MRLTGLPERHTPAIVRHTVFICALLTYLADPVDIIWRFARTSAHPRAYEHLSFATAAALLAVALLLARSRQPGLTKLHSIRWSNLLFAIAIASLFSLPGAFLLIAAEALRSFLTPKAIRIRRSTGVYLSALISMTLFSFTLQDRLAEFSFGATAFLALWTDFRIPAPTALH